MGKKYEDFFSTWFIIVLINQIFIFGACFYPHCIIAALPHTALITFLYLYFFGEKKENKSIGEVEKSLKKIEDVKLSDNVINHTRTKKPLKLQLEELVKKNEKQKFIKIEKKETELSPIFDNFKVENSSTILENISVPTISNSKVKIFPTLENIKRLKVQPTEGEWFLIKYLLENLSNEIEIYFQPFINGDRPDIILIQKGVGVAIIEVKDWNLDSYKIDEDNHWHLKKDNQHLKSPFKQVFDYKSNMFSLHIDGLLEKKLQNKNFYGRIQPYVYFHKASKKRLDTFYSSVFKKYKILDEECNNDFKNKKISWDKYEKRRKYLKQKKSKIERDLRYYAVGNDNLEKIILPSKVENLFTDKIYEEFIRYLQPPYHTLNDGIEITYTKEQKKHIGSQNKHQKIIGVAGSGKTVVLAKKAVNAHKRHGETVLVLTYNLTLTKYIHDKISDVRENFSWGNFYITNYHQLITQLLNNLGVDVSIPNEIQKNIDSIKNYNDKEKYIEEYFEKTYFSNIKLFEEYKEQIPKYKTILIDEIQDYKSEWIAIISTYFLEENSEFVLFGDEKQNIYERELGKDKRPNTKIVGAWNKLKESIRHKNWDASQILPLIKSFQKEFLEGKYIIDKYEEEKETQKIIQGTLVEDKSQILFKLSHYTKDKLDVVAHTIINEIREHNIHNDDVVILASKIAILQEIDYIIRKESNINTITIFEAKEDIEKYKNDIKSIRKFKKIAFNHHSGKLKISTIHSFKGYEAKTVFLIVDEDNYYEELDDNTEIVYTAITRSKFDIMVFTLENSKYNDFFRKHLKEQIL
jgi:hypothetical protein